MQPAREIRYRQIVDLTHPLRAGMPVYPGDPPFQSAAHAALDADGWRISRLTLGTHCGTHLDAPSHLAQHGLTVDQLAPGRLLGPAVVVDVPGGPGTLWQVEHIAEALRGCQSDFLPGGRVIFRSGWEVEYGADRFFADPPGLSAEAARWLADRGVGLLGFDTPGPSPLTRQVHEILLGGDRPAILVESLANLAALPRRFTLLVLPLPLAGLDGSPVRALALF